MALLREKVLLTENVLLTERILLTEKILLTEEELKRNYYFRGGDKEHTFEYGQLHIPEWQGRKEEDVLIDRCFNELKPVVSLCFSTRADAMKQFKRIISKGLTGYVFKNEWGMYVIQMTKNSNKTLQQLLDERIRLDERIDINIHIPEELRTRTIASYLVNSIDLRGKSQLSMLECALLYGYPFID